MTALAFTVLGNPQPKERARRGKSKSGKVVWYTPKRTVDYEAAVRNVARLAVPRGWPMTAAYSLTVTAWLPDGRHRDGDNILKAVGDALQGVLYDNDRRVVESIARRGGIDRENPRTVVEVAVMETVVPEVPKPRPRTDKSATAARSEAR